MSEQIDGTDVEERELDSTEAVTTRRRLFQMGAAGVAAVAGAAAFDALAATPAGATTGFALLIGDVNAPTSNTDITVLNGQFGAHPTSGIGVLGTAPASGTLVSIGVEGQGNVGVQGSTNGTNTISVAGVLGIGGTTLPGVKGESGTGTGVVGTSGSGGVGVAGSTTTSGIGVSGTVPSNNTLQSIGVSGNAFVGVQGVSSAASTQGAPGVLGVGTGEGKGLQGRNSTGPQLNLQQGAAALPALAQIGDFIVLSNGSLHYSYATNQWVQLNNGIVTLPAPVRIINTVAGTGGITGPLVPGAVVHTSSVLSGANGIPIEALGLVGNFAISGVGGALLNGFGVATIYPAGVAVPATANINAGAGCFAISNTVTVAFGTGGSAGKVSIVWTGGGPVPNAEAFFDVTGYIL